MLHSFDDYLNRQIAEFDVTEGYVQPIQVRFLQALLQQFPTVRTIVEVGFNGGHSAAALLSVRPDTVMMSFDLGKWEYVSKAKDLINELYPGRHALIIGDSTQTIPASIQYCPVDQADMIFVDGGHFGMIPLKDMENLLKWLKPDGLIVLDDTNYPHVIAAWNYFIAIEAITEINQFSHYEAGRQWAIGQKHGKFWQS